MYVCMYVCYAMLCYVMLCYAMLCYVMLCYVMLCYAMLCRRRLSGSDPGNRLQRPLLLTSSPSYRLKAPLTTCPSCRLKVAPSTLEDPCATHRIGAVGTLTLVSQPHELLLLKAVHLLLPVLRLSLEPQIVVYLSPLAVVPVRGSRPGRRAAARVGSPPPLGTAITRGRAGP